MQRILLAVAMLLFCTATAQAETVQEFLERAKGQQKESLRIANERLTQVNDDLDKVQRAKVADRSGSLYFPNSNAKREAILNLSAQRKRLLAEIDALQKQTQVVLPKLPKGLPEGSIGRITEPVKVLRTTADGAIVSWTTSLGISETTGKPLQNWDYRIFVKEKGWRAGEMRNLNGVYRVVSVDKQGRTPVLYHIEEIPATELMP